MKRFLALLLLFVLIVPVSEANRGHNGRRNGYGNRNGHGNGNGRGRGYNRNRNHRRHAERRHHRRHHNSSDSDAVLAGVAIGVGATMLAQSCAPEVVEGNIVATDRVLNDLTTSSSFTNAEVFKKEVSRIAGIKDNATKMDAYFKLLDIEGATEVVQFIGARDEEIKDYASSLEKTAALSSEQAMEVAEALKKSLKGSLE